jgi:hypothetical protein
MFTLSALIAVVMLSNDSRLLASCQNAALHHYAMQPKGTYDQ